MCPRDCPHHITRHAARDHTTRTDPTYGESGQPPSGRTGWGLACELGQRKLATKLERLAKKGHTELALELAHMQAVRTEEDLALSWISWLLTELYSVYM